MISVCINLVGPHIDSVLSCTQPRGRASGSISLRHNEGNQLGNCRPKPLNAHRHRGTTALLLPQSLLPQSHNEYTYTSQSNRAHSSPRERTDSSRKAIADHVHGHEVLLTQTGHELSKKAPESPNRSELWHAAKLRLSTVMGQKPPIISQ